jgi:hypothetical protein
MIFFSVMVNSVSNLSSSSDVESHHS